MTFEITLLLFLLAASAFFSGSETALFSLGPIKTRRYRADRPKRQRLTAHILANPRRLLITLLIGNMLVNTLASSVSASLFREMRLPAAAVISAFSITILILIFGETVPKTYAIENAEKVSLRTVYLIYGFSVITYPLRRVIRLLSDLIVAPIIRLLPKEKTLTHGELETAVKMGLDSGAVDAQEQKMIEGVLDFETKKVREIMRPRPDIFALDLSMHLDEIGRAISEHQYSRVPIYDGELSDIVGILYAKDLIEIDRSNLEDFDLKTILRPPYYTPETTPVDKLLAEFIRRKTHMALVVDEYGSLEGLVTLENVLELIVGDIDVKKFERKLYRIVDSDTIIADARLPLDDFNDVFQADLGDELVVTLGGFLMHRMGRIPSEGESLRIGDLSFTVNRSEKNRLIEIAVRRVREPEDEAAQKEEFR